MSVINFEEITEDLNEREMQHLPSVIQGLKLCVTPQKSDSVCELINMLIFKNTESRFGINGVRLRKYVSYIRLNALLPVIATSKGYFVTEDKEEIEKQVRSLYERASQIKKAAEGMQKFIL